MKASARISAAESQGSSSRALLWGAMLALVAVLLGPALAAPDVALAQPLATGIAGVGELSPASFRQVRKAGAQFVRVDLPWQDVAPANQPARWNPQDPADPNYNWSFVDHAVAEVTGAGFTPLMLVESAPNWAQRCKSPKELQYVEVCDPSPAALAEFATAAARRYSGHFEGLPRVEYWQALNEPNLTLFFFPQFSVDGKPLSADLYRSLINSFYGAVKSVDPSNLVIAAGLGPIARKGWTIGPLQFTRELLCMKGSAHPHPIKGQCTDGVHFDIFDIHPYTTGGPTHTGGPNDVELGDMPRLERLLKAADRAGHIRGTVKHTRLWVAEFSWDSKPPDPGGLKMKIETRWVAEALHVCWLSGVENFFWYSLRDEPPNSSVPFSQTLQSGLFFYGNPVAKAKPKQILRAFRFPFVAYPGKRGLGFWGRTPTSKGGRVVIQVLRGGKWRALGHSRAGVNGIFRGTIPSNYGQGLKGAARAVFANQTTASFSMRPVKDFRQKPFG